MSLIGQRLLNDYLPANIRSLPPELVEFQAESNLIERMPVVRQEEVVALRTLLDASQLTVGELVAYVSVIQPNAILRDNASVGNAWVSDYEAPPSGRAAMQLLDTLLYRINSTGALKDITPHEAYCRYECIHPFTDGNGRSGRALWLWMHKGKAPQGFLNEFHYETLEMFGKDML